MKNIVSQPIWPIFTLKLDAMAKYLERSEKEGQISNPRSTTYRIVKIWWKSVWWILRWFVWEVLFERNKRRGVHLSPS